MKNLKPLKETTSPSYGPDDPVKKKPRFQSKPDRKHHLFVKHELVAAVIESQEVPLIHFFDSVFDGIKNNCFLSVGERKEDHRKHEAAGKGDHVKDGKVPLMRRG